MEKGAFEERLADVRRRIDDAAVRSGRRSSDVTLVAVSKFHPVEAIQEALACGQTIFGENYIQEALAKQNALQSRTDIRWHCIGHVQTNKAKDVAGKFALIHTVDSIRLAEAIARRLPEGSCQDVLLQINLGDEVQKSGIGFDEAPALMEALLQVPGINVRGLMGMPPAFDAGEAARPFFARLRECRDALERRMGRTFPELSMGMSGDFEPAIEEGATIVRIGTTLFGARPAREIA